MLDGLFSLTPNMIARHGIFQLLDGVSFSSRQPLFTNKTRLMKPAMRTARRSEEDLPLILLKNQFNCISNSFGFGVYSEASLHQMNSNTCITRDTYEFIWINDHQTHNGQGHCVTRSAYMFGKTPIKFSPQTEGIK
ncbi:hypothetical protein T12_7627 [Trichinella patagoniensis]|uniref:Uncharacterized protein n=1 Tax=Trichinella patagoniensis TaxID=990121 RepID=A0A0V0Z5E3_9BILA|nr:hypothetical protein T12_7627 [Trichinella patagoniensis]